MRRERSPRVTLRTHGAGSRYSERDMLAAVETIPELTEARPLGNVPNL